MDMDMGKALEGVALLFRDLFVKLIIINVPELLYCTYDMCNVSFRSLK